MTVLHYDRDYDTLAGVLEFDSRWLARPGTLAGVEQDFSAGLRADAALP